MEQAVARRIDAVRPNLGAFDDESGVLAEIVRRLVAALDPAMIWLFGSRARQDARPDSDFDILVVARDGAGDGADDYDMVYAPLKGLAVGVDVVPCDRETYLASLELRTSFVRRVVGEGRLLYEARS